MFQAASANLDPGTEATVDYKNSKRGPLLVVSGEKDNTVPHAVAHASFERHQKSSAVTEFKEFSGRGHSLTIDHGWQELADYSLKFAQRHALQP